MGWYKFARGSRLHLNTFLVLYRWAALIITLVPAAAGDDLFPGSLYTISLMILAVYNLLVTLIHGVIIRGKLTFILLCLVDILMGISAAALTGQWTSPFFFYSLMPVFTGAVLYRVWGAAAALIGYILGWVGIHLLTDAGLFHRVDTFGDFMLPAAQALLFLILYGYSSFLFKRFDYKDRAVRLYENRMKLVNENSRNFSRLFEQACRMSSEQSPKDTMDDLTKICRDVFKADEAFIFILHNKKVHVFGNPSLQDEQDITTAVVEYLERCGNLDDFESYSDGTCSIVPVIRGKNLDGVILLRGAEDTELSNDDAVSFSMIANLISSYIKKMDQSIQNRKEAVLEERRRIAQDLHDGPTQALFFISAEVQKYRRILKNRGHSDLERELEDLQRKMVETVQDIRRYIHDLKTGTSRQNIGFECISHFVDKVRNQFEVDIEYLPRIRWEADSDIVDNLFRIVQEGVYNSLKYAHAQWIRIFLDVGESIILMVDDDGRGFEPDNLSKNENNSTHLGLKGIRERVESMKGQFQVRTTLGQGTSLYIKIPNQKGAAEDVRNQVAYSR